jgi:porin
MAVTTTQRLAVALMLFLLAQPVAGQTQTAPAPDKSDQASPPTPSIASSLGAFGDPGGARAALGAKGITYSVAYVGEVFDNLRGGIERGAVYEGRFDLRFDVDLDKLIDLPGLAFHAQFLQIHGRGPTRRKVGNFMTISNIEALPSTRLDELWLEQTLLDGKLAVRAGQLSADSEFLSSQTASVFINGTFGWPDITNENLPAGGIAYPWATPGVRVKVLPASGVTLLGAVFNGDPSGGGSGEPLRHNQHGTQFPLHNAPFFIGEAAYAYNQEDGAPGLPGTIKVGGWYHAGRFNDQRYDTNGLSLADPASSGIARRLRGNYGLYAMAEQMLWRRPETSDQGLAAFARVSTAPGDRNPAVFYADGGLTFKGVLPGRPDDMAGIAFGYAKASNRLRAQQRDARAFGATTPILSSEVLLEVTYQAQLVPGWTLQPDLQYIRRPSGGVANPANPTGQRIKDAVLLGLRTTIQY